VDPASYPGEKVQGEPNGSFDGPITVILDAENRGHLAGTISSATDLDMYVFTTLQAGDRLILDAAAQGGNLDADIALFDEAGRILFENDDRSLSPPLLDPYANQIIRRESRVYYLALYRSPLATQQKIGMYEVLITVVPGGEVPPGEGQTVVLDFDGGSIVLIDSSYTVGSFDAADISPFYAGMTAAVRSRIAAVIRDNYEGLALDVRNVPGDSIPAGESYSTLLFGGRSPDAYGEAQVIDTYNADPTDSAIIFTEMFTPGRFGGVLTADELGTAIGNVAAHELGHLLGLNHVANVADFMDTTGDSSTLLDPVGTANSPLHGDVAPLGTQDSFLLLLETLGAAL